MSVYVISSYVDRASISKHFPRKKNAAKYFSTLFSIDIPILLKKFLQEAPKFQFSKFQYIHHFFDIYINVEAKVFGLL